MEKEFIGYNEALTLKELGFDEPCFKVYDNLGFLQEESAMNTCEIECDCVLERYLAPLYQQAFRWFREKHKLHSSTFWMEIDKSIYWNYRYSYLNDKSTESVNRSMVYFNTPEEAELECLKKLIEIVKEKK